MGGGDLLGTDPNRSRPPAEYRLFIGTGDGGRDDGDDGDDDGDADGADFGVSGLSFNSPVVGDLAAAADLGDFDDAMSTNTGRPHWKFSWEWKTFLKILQSTAIALRSLSVWATGAFLRTASAKTYELTPGGSFPEGGPFTVVRSAPRFRLMIFLAVLSNWGSCVLDTLSRSKVLGAVEKYL